MIVVLLLAMLVFAMAVLSYVLVGLSLLWVIASLLFAPFAGRMYERAATAAGVQQAPRTLRRSGMLAGALLIVPWVYMMRHLRDGEQRTGAWVFHPRAAYLMWLLGPNNFLLLIAVLGVVTLLSEPTTTSIFAPEPVEPVPAPAWVYGGMVAGPLSLVSLLRVSSTPLVRALPDRPWSLLRPYAWTALWAVVAIIVGVFAYLGQEVRLF